MSELTEGWSRKRISSLCEKVRGVSYKRDEAALDEREGYSPILRANNIDKNRISIAPLVFVPNSRISERQRLQRHDVVIAMSSGSKDVVGKAAQIENDWAGSFGAFCGVLRPIAEVNPRYFGFFFSTTEYRQKISSLAAGTNINNIKNEHFDQIEIPVAPLREQGRIVAKLEELLAKVEAFQKRLAKIPVILKRFRKSVLAAACSGRLTADWRWMHPNQRRALELLERVAANRRTTYIDALKAAQDKGRPKPRKPSNLQPTIRFPDNGVLLPETWLWISISDVASASPYSLSSGPFGSALGTKDYTESGVPVIRGQNIQDGRFILQNFVFVSQDKAKKLARSIARPGDVVVVAVGSSGQAALIPNELPRSVLSQNCNKITVDGSLAEPRFVAMYLRIEIAQAQLREKTTDTARPFLSLRNLKQTLLPVPPLAEQQEIVRRVEALFKFADQIDARYQKAQQYVDKLTQCILAKAFRGELVPTEAELARREGREYEPSSDLLNRIAKQDLGSRNTQ